MQYGGIDGSWTGKGTKIGAAEVAGREWIGSTAAAVRLGVPVETVRAACKRLGVPKHKIFWRIDEGWLDRLKAEFGVEDDVSRGADYGFWPVPEDD
jgi:hypothetical protein